MYVNIFMTEQINKVTKHINTKQMLISRYINMFKSETKNRIKTLEDENLQHKCERQSTKNLISVNNNCIENMLPFKEAQCDLDISEKPEVVEIMQEIIIFKNFIGNITHDRNKLKVIQKGAFLI